MDGQGGDRPDPRDRHQPRRLFALPRALPEFPVESADLVIELPDPPEEQPAQLDDRLRQATVPVIERPGQLPDPGPALRSNNAVLGQVTPKRIDRLRALAHQQVTGAKEHPLRLLRLGLDRHEVHGRTLGRFRDRLRVRRVVLVPLDEGLHVDRRNQPHLVTERHDLPAPVVGAGARLHRHRARRLRGEKAQQLPAPQLPAVRHRPVRLRPVYLKAPLCQIDPDDANLFHVDASSLRWFDTIAQYHLGTLRCRREGASTPSDKEGGATYSVIGTGNPGRLSSHKTVQPTAHRGIVVLRRCGRGESREQPHHPEMTETTTPNLNWIANYIWGIADVLRDVYVRGKYRDVILPMTVLRRLDAVLEPTKQAVLDMKAWLDEQGIVEQKETLRQAAGQAFYNTSKFTLHDLRARASRHQLKADFEDYLDGFSPSVQDILENFEFRNQIPRLSKADALGSLIQKLTSPEVNLSPDPVIDTDGTVRHPGLDNHGMGTIFEELIRRFNEENNEEAGEHFTPRDAVKLMAKLVFLPVADHIESGTYLLYDGACGTGGMLTVAEDVLQQLAAEKGKQVSTHLHGQEINAETYAICKADLLLKGEVLCPATLPSVWPT